VAKFGTSNPDRTISLKRLQCLVENKHKNKRIVIINSYTIRLYKAAIIRLYGRNMQLCMITIIEGWVLTDCLYCCVYGQVSDFYVHSNEIIPL
jgi:hypothetical protein